MDVPPAPPAIVQLAKCGLEQNGLKPRYDGELQSVIITVTAKAKADPTKFICMYHTAWGAVDLEFEDQNLGHLYQQFATSVGKASSEAQARAWLTSKGLIEKLPNFVAGEPPAAVMEKLESFCSIKPGAALQLAAPGLVSIQPRTLAKRDNDAFECLLYAMMAVDLSKTGLKFGFVGNEALHESKKD
jgi:hypothetical protein